MEIPFLEHMTGRLWLQAFMSCFFAVLFIQSGLDKVFNREDNLSWLTDHFSGSILAGWVPVLLGVITMFEILAGGSAAVGVVEIIVSGNLRFATAGAWLAAVSLLMLFFGQRVAKDYVGAGGLVPYFLMTVFALYLLM